MAALMWAVITTLAAPTLADPTACEHAVLLEGNAPIRDTMRQALNARGIDAEGGEDCMALVVTVSEVGGKVLVVVTDAAGTEDARLVTDAATAATFVESRVRSDLAVVPGLDAVEPPLPSPHDVAPKEIAPPLETPVVTPALASPMPITTAEEPPSDAAPFGIRLRPGASIGSDGSSWIDLSLHTCVRIEPVCLGALLRGSLDLGLSGRSAELLTGRAGLDALMTTEFPIHLEEAAWLSPGLGIGAGWLRAEPRGSAEGPPEAEVVANFGGLRLEAYLRGSWSIADRWAVGAALFGVLDPTAHTDDILDPDAVLAGNPIFRGGLALELTYGAP